MKNGHRVNIFFVLLNYGDHKNSDGIKKPLTKLPNFQFKSWLTTALTNFWSLFRKTEHFYHVLGKVLVFSASLFCGNLRFSDSGLS